MMNHISKELIGSAAAFFKVLGDETRMKILCTIADSEVCVNDIAEAVDMTKSAVSHQLKLLKDDDLVKSRREQKHFLLPRRPACHGYSGYCFRAYHAQKSRSGLYLLLLPRCT